MGQDSHWSPYIWGTLKESTTGLYQLQLPPNQNDLERRLELALSHYVCFRPHEGLREGTPFEAFPGVEREHLQADDPARGRPPAEPPFRIAQLDPVNRRFAIVVPAA